eukprot:symbB.v1.2.031683.t1/scaffold3685.1/size104757/8
MFHEMRLRVQLYVDDPMVSMRGTPEQIHDMTNRVLMLWRTLGLKISWAKGALGEEADWIGAGIKVNNHKDEVTVFITEEKVQEWKCLIAEAAKKPMVSKRQVSRLAGKVNWAAGMIQQAKPFVRMLYSAISHCTTMKDGQEVIYQQQLAPALGEQAPKRIDTSMDHTIGVIAANDVIEIPSSPEPVAWKLRNTEPMVKPYARGSTALVNDTEADEQAFQKAVKEFEDDKMAASSLGSYNSRVKWWENRATAAGMLSFPLQRSSVRHAGVMLKAGQYRSAAIYLSAMKREHIARWHEWSDSLSQEVKDAIRSCARGLGPDKRSLAFDLMQVAKIEELKPVAGGPRLPKDTAAMVETFHLVAGGVGMSEDQRKALTGHALRATGAQFMARRGIEYYKIQLYCRWGSETILKYLRDAPLEGAEDWVAESVAVEPSVEEVIEQSVHSVASQGGVREETVERLVQQLLETTHVSQVFMVILRIVEELKTKKILIDDHWVTELSRRFLPRYVLNLSSNKLHAVKDSLATGCGFDWRGSSDCTLYNNVPTLLSPPLSVQ